MTFKVVDREQWLACGDRQAFSREQGDHHPADQPGASGRGDGVHLADPDVSLGQHPADQPGQYLDMRAGGNFGDHAAKRAMRLILPHDRLRENLPVIADQRYRAIVT